LTSSHPSLYPESELPPGTLTYNDDTEKVLLHPSLLYSFYILLFIYSIETVNGSLPVFFKTTVYVADDELLSKAI